MEYNLVKLENLARVVTPEDNDLLLLSTEDGGTYQSKHLKVFDAFNSINIRLNTSQRNAFAAFRDTSCIDLEITAEDLQTQADANQAILDIFDVFGAHICELEANGGGGGGVTVVDLSYIAAADKGTVTSSAGDNAEITLATDALAGLMSPEDKKNFDSLSFTIDPITGDINLENAVDLEYVPDSDKGTINDVVGGSVEIPSVTGSNAGLMTASDKNKLDGIQVDANGTPIIDNVDIAFTAAPTEGTLSNTGGNGTTITAATQVNAGLLLPEDKVKLDALQIDAYTGDIDFDFISEVNLDYVAGGSTGTITNTGGTPASIPSVTTALAGLMLPSDKVKLDKITLDGNDDVVSVSVDLDYTAGLVSGTVTNTGGDDAVIPSVTDSEAGLMLPEHKDKVDAITVDAYSGKIYVETVDLEYFGDADSGIIVNNSGDDADIPGATSTVAGLMSAADKDKLDGLNDLMTYMGTVDAVDIATDAAALNPVSGHVYANTGAGPANSTFNGIVGENLNPGDLIAYGGTSWGLVGQANLPDIEVDLDYLPESDQGTITNTQGDNAVIPLADDSDAGLLSPQHHILLDSIPVDGIDGSAIIEDPTADLTYTASDTNGVVSASGATDATITSVTDALAGLMLPEHKEKVDLLEFDADDNLVNAVVDLDYTASATGGVVTNSKGTDSTIPSVTDANAGLMLPEHKVKVDLLEFDADDNLLNAVVDLEYIVDGVVTNTNGDGFTIPPASDTESGLLTTDHYTLLESIPVDAYTGEAIITDLSYVSSPDGGIVVGGGNTDAEIPLATEINAGLLSPDHFSLLEELENDGPFVKTEGTTKVAEGFGITAPRATDPSKTFTFIRISGDEIKLYHVADPQNPPDAMNLGYADSHYLKTTDFDYESLLDRVDLIETNHDLTYTGTISNDNDVFYKRTIISDVVKSEFADYSYTWQFDVIGDGTVNFEVGSDTEIDQNFADQIGFVDATSFVVRYTDDSVYPDLKIRYKVTQTFGNDIDGDPVTLTSFAEDNAGEEWVGAYS